MNILSKVSFATLLTVVAGSMSVPTVEAGSRSNACETSQSIFTLFQDDCSENKNREIRNNSQKPVGEKLKKPGQKVGKDIARTNFRALTNAELRGRIVSADRNGLTGDDNGGNNNGGGNTGGTTGPSAGVGTSASGFSIGIP